MRNGLIGFISAIVVPATIVTAGCGNFSSGSTGAGGTSAAAGGSPAAGGALGSGGSVAAGGSVSLGGKTGTGGSVAVGGSSSVGTAAVCTNVTPCGGSVVGTWTIASSCLKVGGTVDLTNAGVGCTSAPVTGTLSVTGTWSVAADGTVTDNTTTTGSQQIELPAPCLNISGTTTTCDSIGDPLAGVMGYTTMTCADKAGGGCNCTATIAQSGSIAQVFQNPSASSPSTVAGSVLTVSDGRSSAPYQFCVAANVLTLTPQTSPDVPTGKITGNIVLNKQ